MPTTLFHPMVVHLPMALAVLMPLVAGGLAVARWRGWLQHRTWIVAILLQGVLVASGFVALQTGEMEEDRVEQVVAESAIELHEEAAEIFVWSSVAVLLLLLGTGLVQRERLSLALAGTATVGALAVLALGYRVGEAGGALVYQHGAASAYVGSSTAAAPRGHADDDD